MGQLAIIAEFNPFHNGHKYIIETAKSMCNADSVVSIMSGNFVQRGEPAAWNKYTRAFMACLSGVDFVLELPFPYATGSALDFATGAVHFIHKLGTVTHLAFGAETDDIELLDAITGILVREPEAFQAVFQGHLSSGMPFPRARALALETILKKDLSTVLNQPNNILAIEYLCALKRMQSNIKPIIVKRISSDYHDSTLHTNISSATAIRKAYASQADLGTVLDQVPACVKELLILPTRQILESELLTPYLQSLLLHPFLTKDICDFNKAMQDKFAKCSPTFSYEQVMDSMKSKDITHARIARAILHSILLYQEADRQQFIRYGYIYYANVLALRKNSSRYLREIQDHSSVPIITKKADFEKVLRRYTCVNQTVALRMWQLEQKATQLYNTLYFNLYHQELKNDFEQPLPVL